MRKIFIVLLSIFIFQFSLGTKVSGQDSESSNFISARQTYLSAFDAYNDVHKEYSKARNSYEKFETIAALQEAVGKTKEINLRRADVIGTYLDLLKIIMNSKQYIDASLKSSQTGKINATQAFLITHKENVTKANSRAEINSESQRFEREWNATTTLANETLSLIILGELVEMDARTNALLEKVMNDKGSTLNQTHQVGASETRDKLKLAREKIDKANETMQIVFNNPRADPNAAYNVVKDMSEDAKVFIIDASEFIIEIDRTP